MKERMIVNRLRNFVTSKNYYRIAVLVGIRRVGKTTALMQLHNSFQDSCYIDFSKVDGVDKFAEFYESPKRLLLIDEVAYAPNYTEIIRKIEA